MYNTQLLALWSGIDEFNRLRESTGEGYGPCSVFGVGEEAAVHMISALCEGKKALVLAATERDAALLGDRLAAMLGESRVAVLPPRELQLRAFNARSRELAGARIAALSTMAKRKDVVAVMCAEAAMQPLTPASVFLSSEMTIEEGGLLSPDEAPGRLRASGYERVDKVDAPGQFRLSGGILDVFPAGGEYPYRVEFFDDEIDSVRTYDTQTQRSVERVQRAVVPPAAEAPIDDAAAERAMAALHGLRRRKSLDKSLVEHFEESVTARDPDESEVLLPLLYERATALDYVGADSQVVLVEPNRIDETAAELYSRFTETVTSLVEEGESLPHFAELMCDASVLFEDMDTSRTTMLFALTRTFNKIRPKELFRFEAHAPTRYSAAIPELARDIEQLRAMGTTVLLYAGARAAKLKDDLAALGCDMAVLPSLDRAVKKGERLIIATGIPCGLELPEQKLAVFSEPDIYGARKTAVKPKKRRDVTRFDLFAELNTGDLVVHETYGIGVFMGVVKLTANSKTRDFIKIQYAGSDKLYVPTDQLDRVQKYIGAGEEKSPKLSKLSGGEWGRSVSKVRASVKELAFDLVKLYADRKAQNGYAFSPDSPWQGELEAAFPYEETPDQLTSISQIKADMESSGIMDRLLCGDVGYGKTEVALRAAFKAVQDSKQAAFLVPTTVLAQQHFQTLSSRFANFPVRVELLSRFRTPKEQKAVLKGLKNGLVDVVVGTHRLLAKDVEFKDLGLLVIDEEQRFGVGHKEQIKNIKKTVDVLTLSATPIPRTLHMAMTGVRDMSVIETPPEDRYPVQTYVMEYSDSLARDAITKELSRGGQVFFLYNRVSNMESFAAQLRELVPEARIAMAHGQMPEGRLERTMVEFMEREHDVLLCSTIIESGLDIRNANTLIVYDADKMGLSQLYQLRGRVGRSNRLAYAFFTFKRDKVLSEVAEKRLRAIREFTQFGSGFKIAMRDLEIRGAGNLIGAQQHGHLSAVGYDYYCKLMDEAVGEAQGKPPTVEIDTQMDVPWDAFIPHTYIEDESQRLEIYKRIASITSRDDVPDVTDELIDRFGTPPASVMNLLEIAALKSACTAAGLSQFAVKDGEARLRFHKDTRVTGAALITAASQYKGKAVLLSFEPAELLLTRQGADAFDMAKSAESLLLDASGFEA